MDSNRGDISEKLKLAGSRTDKRLIQYYNKLMRLERGNAIALADYTLSYRQDNPGIAESALATYGLYLVRFAQKVNKPFGDMTLNDLLGYLEILKKPDPDQSRRGAEKSWRETWNLSLVIITRFFKWFYYPNTPAGERPKPAIVAGLKKAKPKGGKCKKVFGPKDLWEEEDNEIFFKYCPDPRIKGYHGLAIDTGARPHELLQLKMQDIDWPPDGQGPNLSLNGKTGPRIVGSMCYYKYVREWLEQRPKRSVPSAILFPSKKTGGILKVGSLRTTYTEELRPFFTKLKDESIGQEDRNRINRLCSIKYYTRK